INHASGNIGGAMASGAVANFTTTQTGVISAIELTGYGSGCIAAPTVTITGGGGSGATAVAIVDSGAQQISRVQITNGGVGYTSAPTVSFSGGCTLSPTGAARFNRVGQVNIANPGSGYERNPTCTLGGLSAKCVVAGELSNTSLVNYYGGTGYTTGDVCPIVGAGGSGTTCTVTAVGGNLTGCSAISATGGNYSVGRIVKIGGRAEAVVTVSVPAGNVVGITVTNSGCGYSVVPNIEVVGCTTAPTFNVTIPGGRVTATVASAGAGCPVGGKVVIGENPYVGYADGASAVVNELATDTGHLTFVSVSESAVNTAQLMQLLDRDATGVTSLTRGFSVAYNSVSTTGGISMREAMVRLIHHGVTPSLASATAYFNASLGAAGPAGGVVGNYIRDWPGVGPRYLAGNILNNLNGVTATKSLIDMVNTNTIDLVDTVILLGCGDRVTYSNGATAFSWQQLCTELGPGVW
ncbi:MAG TPA: hypothetical protein PLY93_07580, partial [Turneriella sp.]|nr:hypothetical protein [Turneriella sp.]